MYGKKNYKVYPLLFIKAYNWYSKDAKLKSNEPSQKRSLLFSSYFQLFLYLSMYRMFVW